ncbi:MAG: hypothetical protein ACTS3F_05925 [Phycisphaerales bacterium]
MTAPDQREAIDAPPDGSRWTNLRRSLFAKASGQWHPVGVPFFVLWIAAMFSSVAIAEVALPSSWRYLATPIELNLVRAIWLLLVLGLIFWVNARIARAWINTGIERLSRRIGIACSAAAGALLIIGLATVGPSGLRAGIASMLTEPMVGALTPTFLLIFALIARSRSYRRGAARFCIPCNYQLDDHMHRCPECGRTTDRPWGTVIGERYTRRGLRNLAIALLAVWALTSFGLHLTPPGTRIRYAALAMMMPAERILEAAQQQRFWGNALTHIIWTRPWDGPGERRTLVEALIATPDDIFSQHHATVIMSVALDPSTDPALRDELLARLKVFAQVAMPSPVVLIEVRMRPSGIGGGWPGLSQTKAQQLHAVVHAAYRIEPADGIDLDPPAQIPGMNPPRRGLWRQHMLLGWQPGMFVVSDLHSMGLGRSLAFQPLPNAPMFAHASIALMVNTTHRLGNPPFSTPLSGVSSTILMSSMPTLQADADGRPIFPHPEPLSAFFRVPIYLDAQDPSQLLRLPIEIPLRSEHQP